MKRITLIFFLTLLSYCSYGQLAEEGFEGTWAPAANGTSTSGWFQFQNSVGPNFTWAQSLLNVSTQPPYEGDHAAYLQRESVANGGLIPEDYLVTPQFNVPEEPELRFFSRLTIPGDSGSIYKVLIVNLTTNPTADLNLPASYTELESWTELEINPEQTAYTEIIVELPVAYVGKQVRIAFMMTGDEMDRWLIDNVKVVKKCVPPLALTVSNATLNSADISWENPSGSTSWEIEIVGEADVPGGTGVVYNGTLPYHVTTLSDGTTSLVEDTCYKYYVRSLCDGGGESDWSGPFYFCTKGFGDNCSFPIAITSLPYSDQDDTANFGDDYNGLPGTGCGNEPWENYLNGNDVVYQYTASFTGAIDIDLTENGITSGIFVYNECADIGVACLDGGTAGWDGNPVSLEDFPVVNGEDYYIVISSYDSPSTPYQLIIQAVACDEPTNLSVGATGLTTATLSWDNPSGATSWEVAIQTAGSDIPSGAGTTVSDNSDYLWTTGLVASTAYQYWVRADCGNGTFSAWAGPYQFHTQVCDPTFQCAFIFTIWGGWNGHTMSVKQNGITIATLTGPDDSGDPTDVTVNVCNSMPVQLYWNAGSTSWAANEIGISVKNSFAQTIYVKNPGEGTPGTQLYEVVVDCANPYCLPPEGLTATNATQTTIDLGWAGDATGEWDYYIVPAGSPAPTAATLGTSTTTNPTVGAGPLVAATNYDYYVRMHCENASTDVSNWAGPFAFSSSVCDPIDKCIYSFVLNSIIFGTGEDPWKEVKIIIRQNGANVAVIGKGSDFTNGGTTAQIPLCNNVPFEIFLASAPNGTQGIGLQVINNFEQTIFDVPFFSDLEVGTTLFTSDVDCLHPACLPPTGLASANGTMTSIDLSWDGPAEGNWEYIVLPAGSPAPTEATAGIATTANPTVGVPLDAPATKYDFYLRLICTDPATPTTSWTGPLTIYSEVCDPVDKCIFRFELSSQSGSGFEGNTMTVYQSGVPAAILGPGFSWESSFTVEMPLCTNMPIEIVWTDGGWNSGGKGLHVYSPYMEDVYIKNYEDGSPGETLFEGLVTCDVPACLKPLNLSVSDIELNSASLAWDEQGGATSWEVSVLPFGSPIPTEPGTVVTENLVSWSGLNPSTIYGFYVRANCGDDGYSSWAGPFAFITKLINDNCDGAINMSVNPTINCDTTILGSLTGATASGPIPSCYWVDQPPEYDVWYKFTATDTNHIIAITNTQSLEVSYVLYEGDDCGNLTEISCRTPIENGIGAVAGITELMPGTTYYVQVYAPFMASSSQFTRFNICVSTPASMIVDNDVAVEDIVTNALAKGTCATFENITWSTGTNFGKENGIAYFEKGISTFGIEKGVVLMTGDASKAPGPNLSELGDGGWPGDEELFNYMTALGLPVDSYNDASVLEFDFTPFANKLKFPFIFASKEYGRYQCEYTDAFAFFLTPLNADGTPAGPTTNLAVVPGTNSPVSVVTIRDGLFSPYGNCASVNPEYFDKYYGWDGGIDLSNATDRMTAPVNFRGTTIKMNAESDVIPGQKYHIKLVIADRNDSILDAAVFIGAFNIGRPDLGIDLTVADGNAICEGESYTITSGLDNPEDYTFVWSGRPIGSTGEFVEIPEGTTKELIVTESGEYKLIVLFGDDGFCDSNDAVTIEFYPAVEDVTGNPVDLYFCDADGFATFNLSDNTVPILAIVPNPADYIISYHLTAAAAQDDLNPLPLTGYDNVTQGLQEIYVRIVDAKGCIGIKSFNILVRDVTPKFMLNEDFTICEGTSSIISVTPTEPVNYDPAVATYSWTLDGNALADTTSSITATVAGVYAVTVNNQGCPATDSVVMSVTPTPVADNPDDVVECASYTLPALSANNNYYTGTGGTGTMLSAGDVISTSQVLYVYAFSAVTPACTSENSFSITIIPTAVATIEESCQGNDYVLEAKFDSDEIYNADNVTIEWTNAAGTSLGSGVTLTVVEAGSYFLTVTPAGQAINCPVTVEAQIDNTTCLIPRGISPNGDGSNDSFDLTSFGVRKLSIFNRYGQKMYSKNNYTKEWVGQGSNGDELPTGTYFYMVEYSSGETKTGWVYINRQE